MYRVIIILKIHSWKMAIEEYLNKERERERESSLDFFDFFRFFDYGIDKLITGKIHLSIIYINQFPTPTFHQLPKQKKNSKDHRRGSGEQGSTNGSTNGTNGTPEVVSKILFKNIEFF